MKAALETISGPARSARPRMPLAACKTASYALTHLVVAMGVAYALTGSWKAALAIGLIEPAVQTVAYTFHEKGWAKWARAPAAGAVPACGRSRSAA
ncbi:DUF2061 domain-containing protein [Marinicauda algicola]|nr:DUF2061 domain-containing protein [Marinicauda algicola]